MEIKIGGTYELNRKRLKYYIDHKFFHWDRTVYDSNIVCVKILDRYTDREDLEIQLGSKLYHIEYSHNGYYFPEDCFSLNRKNKLKRILR